MGIRNALRQATSPLHDSLGEHLLLATLQTQEVTLDDLICITQAFAAVHATAAQHLKRLLPDLDYVPFPHAAVLMHDLRCLDSAPDPALQPDIPEFSSLADAAGYLYVAEGSLLGNRLIARHLVTTLPEYHRLGCCYYDPGEARITAHWMPLCALLERLSDNPAALGRMTYTACRTLPGSAPAFPPLQAGGRVRPDSRPTSRPPHYDPATPPACCAQSRGSAAGAARV